MFSRFAVISDIHGNTPALEAVLADIRSRGLSLALNLGDTLYGPLDPVGSCDLLRSVVLEIIHIRGNGDRLLLEPPADARSPTLEYCLSALGPERLSWLGGHLPGPCRVFGDILACHGSPLNDTEYLLEEMSLNGNILKTLPLIAKSLGAHRQKLILCGHSHLPRVLNLPDGKLAVNPGSVGLPAYHDELPAPHSMETGSTHARYAILEKKGFEWAADLISLPYDCKSAARMARRNGRPDWAQAIMTGYAAS